MATSVAIDGQLRAPDGKVITIDRQSRTPTPEARGNPPADGQRSFATQILNVTMVNDAVQRREPPSYYSQGRSEGIGDVGERLYRADGRTEELNPRTGRPYRAPSIVSSEITDIGTRITGESQFILSHRETDPSSNLAVIGSEQELRDRLQQLTRDGRMPVTVLMDANHPAFNGSGQEANKGSWHVVTITGFNPQTGEVQISNQWGRANDKTISIGQLYESMREYPPAGSRTRGLSSDGTKDGTFENMSDTIRTDRFGTGGEIRRLGDREENMNGLRKDILEQKYGNMDQMSEEQRQRILQRETRPQPRGA